MKSQQMIEELQLLRELLSRTKLPVSYMPEISDGALEGVSASMENKHAVNKRWCRV